MNETEQTIVATLVAVDAKLTMDELHTQTGLELALDAFTEVVYGLCRRGLIGTERKLQNGELIGVYMSNQHRMKGNR